MSVGPHATAITNQHVPGSPIRLGPARAVMPDPGSSTRSGAGRDHHCYAAAGSRLMVSQPEESWLGIFEQVG
jgi:hypothetical protein